MKEKILAIRWFAISYCALFFNKIGVLFLRVARKTIEMQLNGNLTPKHIKKKQQRVMCEFLDSL